jgi:hypothetical protein
MKERIKRFIETTLAYFGIGPRAQAVAAQAEPLASSTSNDSDESNYSIATEKPVRWPVPIARTRAELGHIIQLVAQGVNTQCHSPVIKDVPELAQELVSISRELNLTDTEKLAVGEHAYAVDFKPQLSPLPDKALTKTGLSQALWSFGTALRTQVDGSLTLVADTDMSGYREHLSTLAGRLTHVSAEIGVMRPPLNRQHTNSR